MIFCSKKYLQEATAGRDLSKARRDSFIWRATVEGRKRVNVTKLKLTAGPCALLLRRGFPLMESISVTQDAGSWTNRLLLLKPCACQHKSVVEVALGTGLASFCCSSGTVHVWVVVQDFIVQGNAPDPNKSELFPCCEEGLFWGMKCNPRNGYVICYREQHQDGVYRSLQSNVSL